MQRNLLMKSVFCFHPQINFSLQIHNISFLLSFFVSFHQNCLLVSGLKGREYKPQQSRILLFLKNIDLLFVDKWGTSDVIELLLQLIQRNGFYSDSLEWINVSGLQVCASMTSNNSKQNLSPRYLSINSYLSVGYPSTEDMQIIVHNHLQVILERFKSSPKISTVVENLMQFFEEVR